MESGNPMKLNFEDLEMQKWNMPTDIPQKVDGENGVICLVIMLTLGAMVSKIQKMAPLLYFLMTAKNW